jgi:hypothetical protein
VPTPIQPNGQSGRSTCPVCQTVDLVELTRLDLLAGDPTRWPRTLWKENGWDPPTGLLPPKYRTWGQYAVTRDWLDRHGYEDLKDQSVRTHLKHVPKVARSPQALANAGLIEGEPIDVSTGKLIDPNAYLAYYAAGVRVGIKGLELLEKRIKKIEASGEDVPLDLIRTMVDAGSKLATSQAQIRSRGVKMGDDADDDAFRRAASPEPDGEVTRIRNHRIRTIDGEARPVTDTGRGDRADYNERAAREGLAGLPT